MGGDLDQMKRRTEAVLLRAGEKPTPDVLEHVKTCAEQLRALAKNAEEHAKALEAAVAKVATVASPHPKSA